MLTERLKHNKGQGLRGAALGIASANFFTARYLTPLAKSGYIAVVGGEKNRYLPGKQYRILRKGKAVVRA